MSPRAHRESQFRRTNKPRRIFVRTPPLARRVAPLPCTLQPEFQVHGALTLSYSALFALRFSFIVAARATGPTPCLSMVG